MSNGTSSALPKYVVQEQKTPEDFTSHLCQYQGFWFPPKYLQSAISCQKHFQAQNSDILLVSTPKSGTTWLKAIIFTLINRDKHPPSSKSHPLISANPHDLVLSLEIRHYDDTDIESLPSPRLFSTHMPYVSLPESVRKTGGCKIVYVCRNPKDVLVSLWHFRNKLISPEMGTYSLAHVFAQFCNGQSSYGPFWDHFLEYWSQSKKDSDKVFFLKFEDLKRDPEFYLRSLAEFLECPFSAEEEGSGMVGEISKICSFENLSSLEINQNGKLPMGVANKEFFRRGEVGDWENYLTDEMVDKLDEITEKKFAGSGLVF